MKMTYFVMVVLESPACPEQWNCPTFFLSEDQGNRRSWRAIL